MEVQFSYPQLIFQTDFWRLNGCAGRKSEAASGMAKQQILGQRLIVHKTHLTGTAAGGAVGDLHHSGPEIIYVLSFSSRWLCRRKKRFNFPLAGWSCYPTAGRW